MERTRSKGNEKLEAAAAAFLEEAESPRAPDRLREYGLRRVLSRAKAGEAGEAPATTRRLYRNPALLRHALVVALVLLMVMVVSTTGAYAFSLDAQPDSPLYGTKIFFERARITFTTSSTEDILLEMRFSERRMRELRDMVASGNHRGAERWLSEYSRNIEGAGILFEMVKAQEAEELSSRFQEMLDQQAQMMQGLREGQPSGLSEPIEGAYHVCDQERARMRQRCGQQDPGGSTQEPSGQGQDNCPRSEDSSLQEEAPSSTGIEPGSGGAESEGPGSVSDTPSDTTTDAPTDTPPYTSEPESDPTSENGRMAGDMGYQSGSLRQGHMP